MPAQTILGHYRIIREIARSNDIVYEALDERIHRRVAIKELNIPHGATDSVRADRIQRFLREARAGGSLSHPNIVTIHETEEEDGRYFIVMEYLEGETLRNRMEREGALPPESGTDIAGQILSALMEAHTKGVIHRDLKPENIHLLPDGRVKITDFGIARLKFEPSITIDGQIFGTPSYMSPEQVLGKEIDERSDLFSVGSLLFEMLAGHKAFQGDSVVSITHAIMNSEPAIPQSVPTGLEHAIRKALQKDPQMRFSSAGEMKRALEEAKAAPQPLQATVGATGAFGLPPAPDPTMIAQAPPPVQPPVYIPPPAPAPWMTPETRHFLGTVGAVVLIGLVILGVLGGGYYLAAQAYERYELHQQDARLEQDIARAEALFETERFAEAATVYGELAQRAKLDKTKQTLRRNGAIAAVSQGHAYYQRGNLLEAERWYRQSFRHAETHEGYGALGQLLEPGDPVQAAEIYEQAASLTENGIEYKERAARIYLRIGDAYYAQGDNMGALRFWGMASRAAPGTEISDRAQEQAMAVLNERYRRR